MPLDVFISFHHDDLRVAKAVCDKLEAASMSCWFSHRDERPGEDWMEALVRGLDNSQIVVFILSADSNKSSACRKELVLADEKGMPIIPLRIQDVSPTGSVRYILAGRHRLDAITRPIDRHLNALVAAVRSLIEALPSEEAPPQTIKESVDKSKPNLLDLGIQTSSEEAQPFIEQGFTLDNLGRYEEAIACYDKALENDPRLDKAWSNKGTISYNLGRFEEAIACFNKALEINPNSKKARELKQSSLRRLGEEM